MPRGELTVEAELSVAWRLRAGEGVSVDPASGVGAATIILASLASEPGTHEAVVELLLDESVVDTARVVTTLTPAAAQIDVPSLAFVHVPGAPLPEPLGLELTFEDEAAVGWTASASAGFDVAPAEGTGGRRLTVRYLGGLAPGDHAGEVTVQPAWGQQLATPITVEVTAPPQLVVEPAELQFDVVVGEPWPTLALQLGNAGAGELQYEVVSAPSLAVAPSSGAVPATLDVGLDPTLGPGVHELALVLGGSQAVTVLVHASVGAAPTLTAQPSEVGWVMEVGTEPPTTQVVISTEPGDTVGALVAESPEWLTVNIDGPVITVGAQAGLPVSEYDGSVTLESVETGATATVGVTLAVVANPVLDVTPSVLSFTHVDGEPLPGPQPFEIANAGTGTLDWSVVAPPEVAAQPQSGSGDATVQVAYAGGLPVGVHTLAMQVSSSGQIEDVSVVVAVEPGPALQVSPPSLEMTWPLGGTKPAGQLTVSNAGGGTLAWTTEELAQLELSATSGIAPTTIVVKPAASLEAGEHELVLAIQAGGEEAQIPVSVIVLPQPVLSLHPDEPAWEYVAGDAPSSLELFVGGENGSPFAWSIELPEWLVADPTAGDGPALVFITPKAGLSPGTYTGPVTVHAPMAQEPSVSVVATVTVVPPAAIAVSGQAPLTFEHVTATPLPAPTIIEVSNAGGGTLHWSVSGPAWLDIQPAGGTGDGAVSIAYGGSLTTGSHEGEVLFSVVGAEGSTVSIPVVVTVVAQPELLVSGGPVDFGLVWGWPGPAAKELTIAEQPGAGPLQWTASAPEWLVVEPPSGAGGGTITVRPVEGLAVGDHEGQLTIAAPSAAPTTVTIAVSASVEAQPQLVVAGAPLVLTHTLGSPAPSAIVYNVDNGGGGPLEWSVESPPWLLAEPTQGSGPGSVGFTLAPGVGSQEYTGQVVFSADLAVGSPVTIPATAVVEAQPQLQLAGTPAIVTVAGVAAQASETLLVTNEGGGVLQWTASASPGLVVVPEAGAGPAELTIAYSGDGLPVGDHLLEVVVTADGATGSPWTAWIPVTVEPPPELSLDTEQLRFVAVAKQWASAAKSVVTTNLGGGALSWTITSAPLWLLVAPEAGVAGDELTVSVLPEALASSGLNQGQIVVSDGVEEHVVLVLTDVVAEDTGPFATHFAYDEVGRLTSIQHPDDAVTSYGYGVLDAADSWDWGDGVTVVEYDAAERPIVATGPGGVESWGYDDRGRLASVTQHGSDGFAFATDSLGQVTKMTYPDGSTVSYDWDGGLRLQAVSTGAAEVTYTYDDADRVLQQAWSTGHVTTFEPGPFGPVSASHATPNGELLVSWALTYTTAGRLDSVVETTGASSETRVISYSPAGRLSMVVTEGETIGYSYDAYGRRAGRAVNGQLEEYAYDFDGRLIRAGERIFRYDARGRRVAELSPVSQRWLTWDGRDRLVSVTTDGQTVQYTYGPSGLLAGRSDGVSVDVLHSAPIGGRMTICMRERTTGGVTTTQRWIHGHGLVAQEGDGGAVPVLLDPLSHVRQVGAQPALTGYTPFGIRSGETADVGFEGEWQDPATGYVYLRARIYDPSTGVFLSKDPHPPLDGVPATLDRYAYAVHDPIHLDDPDGEIAPILLLAGAAGLLGGVFDAGLYIMQPGDASLKEVGKQFGVGFLGGAGGTFVGGGVGAVLSKGKHLTKLGKLGTTLASAGAGSVTEQGVKVVGGTQESISATGLLVDVALGPFDAFPVKNPPGAPVKPSAYFDSSFADLVEKTNLNHYWTKELMDGYVKSNLKFGYSAADQLAESYYASDSHPKGGVSLDVAATGLSNLADIDLVTFDAVTGQLVLTGRTDTVLMEPLDLSDVLAAYRSIFRCADDEAPGVTMGNVPPPVGFEEEQGVKYFGCVDHTRLGWVLFEADRMLKSYSMGEDNVTHVPIQSAVPGYQSELDLALSLWDGPSTTETRLWIVPEAMTLATDAQGSAWFEEDSLQVLTETKLAGDVIDSPAAETFAAHFTEHFDAFAAEAPIFAEVQRYGRVLAIMRMIADQGIPVDLQWMDRWLPEYHATPYHTPTHSVSESVDADGSTITIKMTGGVDFDVDNGYVTGPSAEVAAEAQAVLDARPGQAAQSWTVAPTSGGAPRAAVALSLAPERRVGLGFLRAVDVSIELPGDLDLTLERYCAPHDAGVAGPFGFCWQLERFEVSLAEGTLEIGNFDAVGPWPESVRVLDRRESLDVDYGVDFVTSDGQRLGYTSPARAGTTLYAEAGGGWTLDLGAAGQHHFDAQGRLSWSAAAGAHTVTFERDAEGRVSALAHSAGATVGLTWAAGRVVEAEASSGVVGYGYSEEGDLVAVTRGGGTDAIPVENHVPQTVADDVQVTFDVYGRLQTLQWKALPPVVFEYGAAGERTITLPDGASSTTVFDALQRPISSTDPMGLESTLTYADGAMTLTDPADRTTVFEFGAATGALSRAVAASGRVVERVTSTCNAMGVLRRTAHTDLLFEHDAYGRVIALYDDPDLTIGPDDCISGTKGQPAWQLAYDDAGQLVSLARPEGPTTTIEYDDSGRAVEVTLPSGATIARSFDELGRLETLKWPGEPVIALQWDEAQGVMTSIGYATAPWEVAYDAQGFVATLTPPHGGPTTYARDEHGWLTGAAAAGAAPVSYSRDLMGRVTSVTCGDGWTIALERDPLGRVTTIETGTGL